MWGNRDNGVTKMKIRNRKQRGFSLIELLIVVAIILIIAAIAIPKLLQARTTSAQNAGAATMRSINTALTAYDTAWDTFPDTPTKLGGNCQLTPATAALACVLDDTLAADIASSAKVGQYVFTYAQVSSGSGFTLNADPAPGASVARHYFSDQNNTIHYNDNAAAIVTDPPLGK